jgi:hypothetical protein
MFCYIRSSYFAVQSFLQKKFGGEGCRLFIFTTKIRRSRRLIVLVKNGLCEDRSIVLLNLASC